MADRFHELSADGVSLVLDLAVGHIRRFEIESGARRIRPLHTAPWVDDPEIAADPDILGNLKYLSGDFFCAPFGKSDVEAGSPVSHGWPANTPWRSIGDVRGAGFVTGRFVLEHPVMGARVIKQITLRDGHPFAYEQHTFEGGSGGVSASSHAMTRFATHGRVSFSPKAFAETPAMEQEMDPALGRSVFAPNERTTDLSQFPLRDGTTADLHRYPIADRHEDFVMLVEAPGASLGWAAAVRPDARDIMLSLKNPSDYPVTFLWFSNGGRFYAPWNSRHVGVLGIEEGRAYSGYGHAASVAPNPLSKAGIPTSVTLTPSGAVSLRHVVGGLPLPDGWTEVGDVSVESNALRIVADGGTLSVPFDSDFLAAS